MTRDNIRKDAILPPATAQVARETMELLQGAQLPFLVAGAYALAQYTGIERHTKDFDIFVRRHHVKQSLTVLEQAGFHTELVSGVWLAKAHRDGETVDLIFNSGNAVSPVDDSWFERANEQQFLDTSVLICPIEEMIWTKAFIMERERFDGADVTHLIRCCAPDLDWEHLLERFGDHWPVLLSHLILFQYIYPSRRDLVPEALMRNLLARVRANLDEPPPQTKICRGTLLSRYQYMVDIDHWDCIDARVEPHGKMTKSEADELSPR